MQKKMWECDEYENVMNESPERAKYISDGCSPSEKNKSKAL